MKTKILAGLLLGVTAACLPASANDSALTYGGTIAMLSGHPTVRMESELIKLIVDEDEVTADCRFVFKNDGPTCKIRMGFPDEGYDGGPTNDGGWFTAFRSTVDGKEVKTTVQEGQQKPDELARYWHVKEVTFPAKSRRVIHDLYKVPVGGSMTSSGGYIRTAAYTVSTGASWKGNIGRTEVQIIFKRKSPPLPLEARRVTDAMWKENFWRGQPKSRVYFQGPTQPRIEGHKLIFVRTNWRPTTKDDLILYFDHVFYMKDGTPETQLPYLDVFPWNKPLSDADLKDKTPKDLHLIRNAIYARHGRPFKDKALQSVFAAKSWYKPDPKWQESRANQLLSPLERANLQTIQKYEKGSN